MLTKADDRFMRLAIAEAKRSVSETGGPRPHVGAVVARRGRVLAKAYRGDTSAGDHAEYVALERKLGGASVAGATVYTTLEPCTSRNHPKVPCAERLIQRRVSRVVIGMLDPNPVISGRGQRRLREARIETDLFPEALMSAVEELNRNFIASFPSAGHPQASAPPSRPFSGLPEPQPRILAQLLIQAQPVGWLAEHLGVSPHEALYHLECLESAKLVESYYWRRHFTFYRLTPEGRRFLFAPAGGA